MLKMGKERKPTRETSHADMSKYLKTVVELPLLTGTCMPGGVFYLTASVTTEAFGANGLLGPLR